MSTDIEPKIEKGVKIPDSNVGRPSIYPFEKMKKGDSIFFSCATSEDAKQRRVIITACAYERGYKITTRILPDGKSFKVGVWMVGKRKK